jgi:hypothetical protein
VIGTSVLGLQLLLETGSAIAKESGIENGIVTEYAIGDATSSGAMIGKRPMYVYTAWD